MAVSYTCYEYTPSPGIMQISNLRSRKGPGRAGFTLIEMMITLGIIAILFGIAMQFRPGDQVAKSKSRRLAAAIMSMIDAPKLDALTGRAVGGSGGAFVNPDFVRISISTGAVTTTYMSGSAKVVNGAIAGTGEIVGYGKAMTWPFFGESLNKIVARGVMRADGSRAALADTDTLFLDLVGTQAYFTGSDAAALSGAVGVQIVSEYQGWRSMTEFDARSGRVGTYFDKYPGCNQPDVRLANGQIWAACNVQQGGKGCGPNLCGSDGSAKNYYQWGWSDGSYSDGRTTGSWSAASGPCAIGYRPPTTAELNAGLAYASYLELPRTGRMNSGSTLAGTGNVTVWTGDSVSAVSAVGYDGAATATLGKDVGLPVRCLRNP